MDNEHSQGPQKDNYEPASAEKIAAQENTPSRPSYSPPPGLSAFGAASLDDIPLTRDNLLYLQRTIGNRAVGRLLQRKVKVSQPDDPYELEAERVAEQVLRMPDPSLPEQSSLANHKSKIETRRPGISQGGELHRQAMGEEEEGKRKRGEEDPVVQMKGVEGAAVMRQETASEEERRKQDEEGTLQAKSEAGEGAEIRPEVESRIDNLRSGGEPLSENVRADMEPRFGQDFSEVRVHKGPEAAETARAVNARAYTTSKDIVFGAGEYAPDTKEGKHLLAHELTHVVQQNAKATSTLSLIQRAPGDPDNLKKLDEMLGKFDVPEEEVIELLGKLSAAEKATVLAGGYKGKIASALNVREMIRAVKNLNPTLDVKLEWVKASSIFTAQIDYSDIKTLVTDAPQTERDALKTGGWRDFFVSVCTNDTIIEAVNDLGFDPETKISWIIAEGVIDRPVTDANARQVLDFLKSLAGSDRDAAILKLESEGYLERLLEEISEPDRTSYADVIQSIQQARGMKESVAHITSLLSYGILDWAITDSDAHEVLVNLQNMPDERRKIAVYRMEDNGTYQRLIDNVSSADRAAFASLISDLNRIRGEYHDIMQGTKPIDAAAKSDVDKILTPGIVRDPLTGVPAAFVDTVAGKTYRQDIMKKLDDVRAWMYPKNKTLLAGKKLPMSKFEGIGAEAKNQTDALFGQYAHGPAFIAGTRASGANLIDRSLQTPDPADLVRYLIHNQDEVLPVHTLHSAIPSRATEKAIIDLIITDYSAANKTELEVMDRGWPALTGGGIVELQPFEGGTPDETRRILWRSFQTMIHEYLHTITHKNYADVATNIGGAQESILIEGGTSLFTDDVWKTIFPAEISANSNLRANVEGTTMPFKPSVIPAISHYDQIAQARDIRSKVGDENMRAAYFAGHTELIGLGPTWTPTSGATSQTFTVPPAGIATVADVANATGASAAGIAAANGIAATDAVTAGQQLTVPGIRVHIVLPGGTDTKTIIAQRNGVTETDLERANPGVNWSSLSEGQRIIIPVH
jgi:hypothetical protein